MEEFSKRFIFMAIATLSGFTIFFALLNPSQLISEQYGKFGIYGLASGGLLLEILGFMLFMMIEKKASFGGGGFAGGKPLIDGKPLEKDEQLVVRNVKHERLAINFVIIGLAMQLFSIWHGLNP